MLALSVVNGRKFIPLLVVAVGLLAYHNSFQGPFILDDAASISNNAHIRHLWPIWEALSPSTKSFVGGRPIVNFSLALNYAMGGLAVAGYHAFNLAIHILAGLALYGIVRRTLLSPVLRGRFGASAMPLAMAVAVLWTVHPLQTEAVTYISERCESLMGLFYLLTLYCFIRGTDAPRSSWWFALSVVACLLGMASKEVMVTAPVMVLLYDRTFVSGSLREAWTRHRWLYVGLAGTWLLLGYLMAGLRNRGVGYGLGISWWAYASTECRVVVGYLWLALWPHPLVLDHGDGVGIWHFAEAAPYALILAVLVAGVLFELRRQPAIGFLGAWFFVILAPGSSVVPIAGQPMAEHRMYLPLAAVVTMAVVGAFEIGKRLFDKRQRVLLGCLAGGFVAALFTSMTIQRNRDYTSEITIWQDTVDKRPNNPRAHYNLGVALKQSGRLQEAVGHWEQALRINPDYADAHNNLGVALDQAGRIPEAMEHLEQALRIQPNLAEAHYNLGKALAEVGRVPEAIAHYEQAVRIKPEYAEAHCNLGIALKQSGRIPEAIAHYEQALKIKPDFAEAHCCLGNALLQEGKVSDAIAQDEQALRIKPDFAEAHYNLGLALWQAGKVPEAVSQWRQALHVQPDYAEAHGHLAIALEQTHSPGKQSSTMNRRCGSSRTM